MHSDRVRLEAPPHRPALLAAGTGPASHADKHGALWPPL